MRVSPAKAVINSDRVIAEKLTGTWSPCQESSALQWRAQSKYRLKADGNERGNSDRSWDALEPHPVQMGTGNAKAHGARPLHRTQSLAAIPLNARVSRPSAVAIRTFVVPLPVMPAYLPPPETTVHLLSAGPMTLAVGRAAGTPAHAGISVKFSPSSKASTSSRKSGSGPFSFLTRTLM